MAAGAAHRAGADSAGRRRAAHASRAAADRLRQLSPAGADQPTGPGAAGLPGRQPHAARALARRVPGGDRVPRSAGGRRAFAAAVSPKDAELLLAAALLHDIGHWPFGHPIEDLGLPKFPTTKRLPARDITKAKWPTCCATTGDSNRATSPTWCAGNVQTARDADSPQHALRPDRRRQDRLPDARQPARRRALRPALRPPPADRQPVPERSGRRAGDHRQRQDGRRDDGLRPLRDVQRSLLAPRRALGHRDAAAGVLSAARQARSRPAGRR